MEEEKLRKLRARRIRCRICQLPIASSLEESALTKLSKSDPARAVILRQRRCHCPERYTSAFTSRPQPMDLQAHDKFDA